MFVYSIQDVQIPSFGDNALILAHADGHACRVVFDMLSGGPNPIVQHPEDYILYCVGEFDPVTGVLSGLPPRPVKQIREVLSNPSLGAPRV